MPEDAHDLHVVGCANGLVWHTIRSPGRQAPAGMQWTGFTDVLTLFSAFFGGLNGHAVDVACARRMGVAGLVDGLWILVAFNDRPPLLFFRSSENTWTVHTTRLFDPFGNASKVAIATVTTREDFESPNTDDLNELHIAAVTDGYLQLVFGDADGPVTAPVNPDEKFGYGRVRAVALATMFAFGAAPVEVPLLVVFDAKDAAGNPIDPAGNLGLTRHTPDALDVRHFEPWERLHPGPIVDAALAMRNVVAVTDTGTALLAPNEVPNIPEFMVPPPFPPWFPGGVPITPDWIDLEAFYVTLPWGVTIPYVPTDFGRFATISANLTANGRHFVGTTTDGRLLHQLRPPNATFAFFEDVETAVGTNAGTFTAVDCG